MADAPKCPKCGSTMEKKTARKGRYIGQQFWGCPNWRVCKTVININNNKTSISEEILSKDVVNENIVLPVFLQARERLPGYQVRFFQSLAVPYFLLMRINQGKINRRKFHELNQWRFDYPASNYTVGDAQKQILLMVNKLLTRGRLTISSPMAESSCLRFFNVDI